MLKLQALSSLTLKDVPSDTPFVAYRLPGHRDFNVCLQPGFDGTRLSCPEIEICTWLAQPFAAMPVAGVSTPRSKYETAVDGIVSGLRKHGGKTVICRQICGRFGRFAPLAMAEEYFTTFPGMFCFLFYHPSTGYWMGASPELLLEVDTNGTGHTRALAGTRKAGEAGRWSDKNMDEHRIVVDDICSRVAAAGDDYKAIAGETGNMCYGKIEHLATPVDICRFGGVDMRRIVDAIHPTAAVGGYPLHRALPEIAAAEDTPRYFYGGTMITSTLAYVVLRCVHFDAERWCVYTGSGITASSDAADEWNETEAKAAPLIDILGKY